MNRSFEEKSVWIQLIGMVLGLGWYFMVAGRLLAGGVKEMAAYAAIFLAATAGMVVFLVVRHIIAAVTARPEGRDERDRMFEWRAEHWSSWLVAVGVRSAVTCMVFRIDNVWTANLLLLSLAMSEMLGFVLRLVYYRRGC